MSTTEKLDKTSDHEELLKVAKERFDLAVDAESEIRAVALEDLKFSAGEQWPAEVKAAREQDRRPCLTINRIPQFVRQITNDQRQNRPSIKVSPVDDNADVETSKVLQGIIRHIEYASDADVAYDTAFESTVKVGFGYFRVVTEYCDPFSFEQDIRIKRIKNRFSVYLDPSYQQPDGSDANWGFVFEDISQDDFKSQYPNSELASMDNWTSIGDSKSGWATDGACRVAEYFFKEFEEITICQIIDNNGQKMTVKKDDIPAGVPVRILSERRTRVPVVKWCKINAVEVLEETTWLGRWIPIIPVLGDELDIDGKRVFEGVVRHAKDPQRMYNYWASSETETIALAPRAPFIGVEGQFEGFEEQWRSANVKNHAYLEYKSKSIAGQPVGPPQRNVFEPPVQAISQARMLASEDLKATTGIYDAALGAKSNENSGIAIQRRNIQAQTSNFHFIDNLSRSLKHCGRILVDLIPHIYDTDRAVRILGEDGTEEIIKINTVFEHKGEQVIYNLGHGKYDVTVDSGPSFQTKRQEAVASMADMSRSYPQLMQVAGDLMVKNMDWPGSREIAERIKKTLPPGLSDDPEQKQPLPPEAQAQMQQMNQMIEQLTDQLKTRTDQIEQKTLELESKERIELLKLETHLKIEMAKLDARDSHLLLEKQTAEIDARQSFLKSNEQITTDQMDAEMMGYPDQMSQQEMPPQNMPTDGSSSGQPMEF